ncbi:MAG: A/G-specific adenine glycosylase [Candidatus Neomarinimicrobiota bacterium]|nr:A/G-specific adenine glycosylase [Candidatus Neomarinimicrobiota bacterium]
MIPLFSEDILHWYDGNARDLPWRGENDPYRIWLSEVMLQQTRVETVIPYYNRWLKRFPTLESVAKSERDQLLKAWEGLGYYSRCRNFHEACRLVWTKYGGDIPMAWEAFRSLPGVGDYTAAAVLSIAFNQSYPALDANVRRVMARLLSYTKPMEKGTPRFKIKLLEWMDNRRPGDFNQAMMELGSEVCRNSKPRCSVCPLVRFCQSKQDGTVSDFPVKSARKPRPHRTIVAAIIWREGRFLIQKRPDDGLLGGLWEFPGGKVEKGESLSDALIREIHEETGLLVKEGKKVGKVNHAYTHFSITLHLYHCRLLNGSIFHSDSKLCRWISPVERSQFAFPRANHKLFEILDLRSWSADA